MGALDALTRLEMQTLIEELWLREQFTAVLVTHDVEEAAALADRVLVMEEGGLSRKPGRIFPGRGTGTHSSSWPFAKNCWGGS